MKKLLFILFSVAFIHLAQGQSSKVLRIDSLIKSLKSSEMYVKKDSGSSSIPVAGVGDIKTKYQTEFYFQKQTKNLVKVVRIGNSSVDIKTIYYYSDDKLIKLEETISKIRNESDKNLTIYYDNGKFLYSNLPYEYIKDDVKPYIGNSIRYLNQSKKFK